jgi:phosphatidylglycerol:prolipoprotein diacylglycerol transferase
VDFPAATHGGPRHDLGLYEALWTMVIAAAFWALRKKDVQPGFFTALFVVLYAPARFVLDFLRNTDLPGADRRLAGLTPAQWGMVLMGLGGLAVLARLRRPAAAPPAAA